MCKGGVGDEGDSGEGGGIGGDGDGGGGEVSGEGGGGEGGGGDSVARSTGSHCGGQATPRAEGRAFELRWPMACVGHVESRARRLLRQSIHESPAASVIR